MINKYSVKMQFIDTLVSSLLLQDPENASIMYDMALNLGTLKLLHKLPHSMLPYHRAGEIDKELYKYENVRFWDNDFVQMHSKFWTDAQNKARNKQKVDI